eukprot:GFKZ01012218.1.p1 GENE.GFKZ01012218.1~~GFKZ01012218.1.p1  ORF type:complete len:512 (+),score=53.22 GFKZ01012218.1:629-2164(+)
MWRHNTRLWLFFFFILFHFAAAFNELSGERLKGCVLRESPYVVHDVTRRSGFNGVALDYLHRLQDNLQFTIDLDPWNGTWYAFIKHMSECTPGSTSLDEACACDIGVGSFTVTNHREELINFVWPFSNENHRMIGRKSDLRVDDSKNAWFVFQTFSLSVWGLILLGIFMHSIGTVFFGQFRAPDFEPVFGMNTSVSKKLNRTAGIMWNIKKFPAAVMFSYAHLIGHPFGERPQGTPSFHKTAWLVLGVTAGLFLLTVYEASLTVLLFESTRTSPFRTLRDITDCTVSPDRVAMIRGGASQEFWNKAVNTSDNIQRCNWGRVGMTVSDIEEGFRFVQEGKADFFFSLEGSVLFRAHRNCDVFEPVGEPFFSTSVGFLMPTRANRTLLDTLSRETRILRQQDGYESATLLAARNACDAVVDAKITPGKLAAFFVLYITIWCFLLIYRCIFLWRRRKVAVPRVTDQLQDSNDIVVMDMHSARADGITGVASSDDSLDSFGEFSQQHDHQIRNES